MGYKVASSGQAQTIEFSLDGQLTVQELRTVNQEITQLLDQHEKNASIIIDAAKLRVAYQTANQLQDTQKYMSHRNLRKVVVVSNNKLTRLIMLLAFSLSAAQLIQVDTY